MRADLFDFHLPEQSIALRPARPRDSARMLSVNSTGAMADEIVRDLPNHLESGDVLVVNDSWVIPAALEAVRPARLNGQDIQIKLNLIERLGPDLWRSFAKPGRRLKPGDSLFLGMPAARSATALTAVVLEKKEDGAIILRFDRAGKDLDSALRDVGAPPLPPYIAERRSADADDVVDYQTIYANVGQSVAAPTAGLHFTPELMQSLEARGVLIAPVRLDVGAGTFLPVKTEDVHQHVMHVEHYEISARSAQTINAARLRGAQVVAVGTTSLRALESAAIELSATACGVRSGAGSTQIFITPGYKFRIVDKLLTNFHLPKSTLFMLVCAFSGLQTMQAAYQRAIRSGYRFYSYGDACLLERAHV